MKVIFLYVSTAELAFALLPYDIYNLVGLETLGDSLIDIRP